MNRLTIPEREILICARIDWKLFLLCTERVHKGGVQGGFTKAIASSPQRLY